jgi:lipopolysaccharide export system protein LptA
MRLTLPLAALLLALSLPAAAPAQSIGFGGAVDRGAPVEVAADSLEVDQGSGRAVLTGNVVIAQGGLRLSAEVVEIDYATAAGGGAGGGGGTGARRIERLTARGDVLLVTGEDAAEAREAVYELGSGQVVMTGDVLVTQGASTLAGDRLSVDLDTGSGSVTGRVRTVLQP